MFFQNCVFIGQSNVSPRTGGDLVGTSDKIRRYEPSSMWFTPPWKDTAKA